MQAPMGLYYMARPNPLRYAFACSRLQTASLLSLLNSCGIRHHFGRVLGRFLKLYARRVGATRMLQHDVVGLPKGTQEPYEEAHWQSLRVEMRLLLCRPTCTTTLNTWRESYLILLLSRCKVL